jgi:MFS family permease
MQHDAYAALRHSDYRRFAAGFVVSSTALQMLGMAVGWEIYERTGSYMNLGYIGLVRALPVIALALPAGHLIDTLDRRKVLAITQWAFALVMVGLACASAFQAPLWITYALLMLSGCARVFNGPSRATLVPQLVPPEDFHNATAWNSGVFQFSALAGPLLAGYIISCTRVAWPVYALTAIGCAVFAVLAMTLHPRLSSKQTEPWAWRSVTKGISHLWTEKTILAAITLDMFAVLLGGATAMLPIYAKDILGTGAFGLGVLRAAPYAGAFLMALVLAHRPRLPPRWPGDALVDRGLRRRDDHLRTQHQHRAERGLPRHRRRSRQHLGGDPSRAGAGADAFKPPRPCVKREQCLHREFE